MGFMSLKKLMHKEPFGSGPTMNQDDFLLHIDSPVCEPSTILFEISGWLATSAPVSDIKIGQFKLRLSTRPDVELAHPNKSCVYGFSGTISKYNIDNGICNFNISLATGDQTVSKTLTLEKKPYLELSESEKLVKFISLFNSDPHESILQSFPLILPDITDLKVEKITERLKCLACDAGIIRENGVLACDNGHAVETIGNTFHFLNSELSQKHNLTNNHDIASRSHDPLALALIGKFKDGLILDCGSGLPAQNYANVVNFEIENFINTDVIGAGEALPFKDDSFDVVFSFSVLEHIKNPFVAASEISRVLKTGGILYANTPFLIPEHGYPHHYYNMTQQGLENLFSGLTILSDTVPSSGHPYYAVKAILGIWSEHLGADAKAELGKLTVTDILEQSDSIVASEACQSLSQDIQKIIACTNSLLAQKPSP